MTRYIVTLTEEERQDLQKLVQKGRKGSSMRKYC